MEREVVEIRISNKTRVNRAAGAVAHAARAGKLVELTFIGVKAMSQALKTVATARRYVQEDGGFDLVTRPEYVALELDGGLEKGMKLIVDRG